MSDKNADDDAAWETVQSHHHHHHSSGGGPRGARPNPARRTTPSSSSLATAAAATTTTTGGGPAKKNLAQSFRHSKNGGGGPAPARTYSAASSLRRSTSGAGSGGGISAARGGGGRGIGKNNSSSTAATITFSATTPNHQHNSNNTKSGRGVHGGRGNLGRSYSTPVTPNSSSSNSTKKGGKSDKQQQQQQRSSAARSSKLLSEIVLWHSTGMGGTVSEQAVLRYSADTLLEHRMRYVDAPQDWTPHDRCRWKSSNRLQLLEQQQAVVYNFKPLQTNDETRWQPKSRNQAEMDAETATLDAIQAILNKLSWTNLDKLTNQFLVTLQEKNSDNGIPPAIIHKVMAQVLQKAMREPHFAPLYARLSVKLAQFHKAFKKTLLSQCQEQFEATGANEPPPQPQQSASTDPAETNSSSIQEKERTAALSSKRSIGLMTFIGELYVQQLLKANIVLSCLKLLMIPDDEERLESFCKLMTTTGKRLHLEDDSLTAPDAALQQELWDTVYRLAGHAERASEPTAAAPVRLPSTRLKFLLQALIELQDHDWVPIRHEHEKAQTIQEIHKQAAREAQQGPVTKTASTLKRSQSSGLAGSGGASSLQRRSSTNNMKRGSGGSGGNSSDEDNNNGSKFPLPPKQQNSSLRRVQSASVATMMSAGSSSLQNALRGDIPAESSVAAKAVPDSATTRPQPAPKTKQPKPQHMSPTECAEKFKNVLKEFFISGDRDDAVLSVDEMVAVGRPGHIDRGAAIVEAGILHVLECKESDVRKFIDLIARLLDDNKLDRACLVKGLRGDALELLRDIEIDAPLASQYLAVIVAAWLTKKVDDGETALPNLQFLLQAPAYFISDGRPAAFVCQVLRERNKTSSQDSVTAAAPDDWQLVEKLMSDSEKKEFGTAQNFWDAQQLKK